MKRKIYDELLDWKEKSIEKPLMVIGARQVGKTYIIKEFCKKEFDNYVYINLLEYEDIVEVFAQKISILEKIELLKLIIKKYQGIKIDFENTVIFFDEIQESEELISSLKYFNEAEESYKIICAGSLLGVKLNRFKSSFPVGKVRMIDMYPMDFEEFLIATSGENIINILKEHYEKNEPVIDAMHNQLISLYRLYLCVGGMPESINNILSVNNKILDYDTKILKEIISGYIKDMKKYVKDATETVRIENTYYSIPVQIGNKSGKFQYSKIKKDARSKNYESALEWLLSSRLVNKVTLLKTAQIPLNAFKDEDSFKLYVDDIGILITLLNIKYEDILLDSKFLYKGEIAENYVLQQLNINFDEIYYWKSQNQAEVDFVINHKDGIIPIEVKAGDSVQSKSLYVFMKRFNPQYAIRISTKNFGIANNIKSVPLYAVFLIK